MPTNYFRHLPIHKQVDTQITAQSITNEPPAQLHRLGNLTFRGEARGSIRARHVVSISAMGGLCPVPAIYRRSGD
jgi:hypothetical protein